VSVAVEGALVVGDERDVVAEVGGGVLQPPDARLGDLREADRVDGRSVAPVADRAASGEPVVRGRLAAGGVFICDTYGGESAFLTGHVHRDHWITEGPHRGLRVRYTWEQRESDALSGMVTDVCHFRVDRGGVIEQDLPDAFVYRWRLWSVPELRDALAEAGLTTTAVYDKAPDAVDDSGEVYMVPVEHGEQLEDSFIVCVAGRA